LARLGAAEEAVAVVFLERVPEQFSGAPSTSSASNPTSFTNAIARSNVSRARSSSSASASACASQVRGRVLGGRRQRRARGVEDDVAAAVVDLSFDRRARYTVRLP
jgi:hypothetical protein